MGIYEISDAHLSFGTNSPQKFRLHNKRTIYAMALIEMYFLSLTLDSYDSISDNSTRVVKCLLIDDVTQSHVMKRWNSTE